MNTYSPLCGRSCSLERECLIFGIYSFVLSVLSIFVLSIQVKRAHDGGYRIYPGLESYYEYASKTGHGDWRFMESNTYIALLYLGNFSWLIFSVVLCYGVKKRHAGIVLAYLIYGFIGFVLEVLVTIGYFWIGDVVLGVLLIIVCAVYSLLLLTVLRAYQVFRSEGRDVKLRIIRLDNTPVEPPQDMLRTPLPRIHILYNYAVDFPTS